MPSVLVEEVQLEAGKQVVTKTDIGTLNKIPLVVAAAHKPLSICGIKFKRLQVKAPANNGEYSVDAAKWFDELLKDPFHSIVEMPIWFLAFLYASAYFMNIIITALIFYAVGAVEDASFTPDSEFWTCFQCAWQSVTTVGYGSIAPEGYASSLICALAIITSLMLDAVGIGIFYTRLSTASFKARGILQSTRAVISRANPAHNMPMRFEARAHHVSDHSLVDPSVRLTMARWRTGHNGGRVAIQFQELQIGNEQPLIAFLQYPYSVVHYIDENSPLYPYISVGSDGAPAPKASFDEDHVEIIVTIIGTAHSTGNTCESRTSYTLNTIGFGHEFERALITNDEEGILGVDLFQMSLTKPEDPSNLVLPQCY